CVSDLALRRNPAREGQDALGVGQDGAPILLVAGIHSASEYARVDLGEQIEGILPRVDPIELPLGSLDEAVHRHHQRGDDLSHVSAPFKGDSRTKLPDSTGTGSSLPLPVVEGDSARSTAGVRCFLTHDAGHLPAIRAGVAAEGSGPAELAGQLTG